MLKQKGMAIFLSQTKYLNGKNINTNYGKFQYVQLIIITQRLIPKICEYATQHAEAGSEKKF